MHPDLHPIAEFLGRVLHHRDQCRAQSAPASAGDGVTNMLTQILKETRIMSDQLTTLESKVDALVASEAAAHARVDARDALLTQAQTDRDAAVASVAEAQSEIATLKAELAAQPQDTTAQEARIDAVLTKLDGVKAGLDGMELTSAATEPTTATPPAATTTPPAPATTVPAAIPDAPASPEQGASPEQPAT